MLKETDTSCATNSSSHHTTPDKGGAFRSKLPRRSLGTGDNSSISCGSEHNYLLSSSSVFNDVWKLYLMHFSFVFISRMWDFGIVMLVAQLQSDSLTLVALIGFASSFSVFVFMPIFGHWMDATDRMETVRKSVAIKFLSITVAYLLCAYIIYNREARGEAEQRDIDMTGEVTENNSHIEDTTTTTNNNNYYYSNYYNVLVLFLLPVLNACAGLAFAIINQSVEKDWVVVLADGNFEWLSTTNATMSQIDLFCNSMAPSITGFMFYYYEGPLVALSLMILNAIASVSFYFFMRHLYFLWPPLQYKSTKKGRDDRKSSNAATTAASSGAGAGAAAGLGASSDLTTASAASTAAAASSFKVLSRGVSMASVGSCGTTEQLGSLGQVELPVDYSRHPIDRKEALFDNDGDGDDDDRTNRGRGGGGGGDYDDEDDDDDYDGVETERRHTRNTSNNEYRRGGGLWSCCNIKRSYFNDYLFSGCAGAMTAYGMLYCTVLSFGSLMLVYLSWSGIPQYWIGIASGLSSLFGFSGSLLFPVLSKKFGLFDLGLIAMVYDAFFVCAGAASFLFFDKQTSAFVVIVCVLFSRMGLWTFDLCVRQIAQETISELTRGKVNGIWRSVTSFFTMSSFLLAMLLPNPESFWILTLISASMVTGCLVLFTMTNLSMFTCFGGTGDVLRYKAGGGSRGGGGAGGGGGIINSYSTLQKYEDEREKTNALSQQQLYGGYGSVNNNNNNNNDNYDSRRVSDQFQIEMSNKKRDSYGNGGR